MKKLIERLKAWWGRRPELVDFDEVTMVIAKDQQEYRPMPANGPHGKEGQITCCWRLSWRDRLKVLWTGQLWHQVWTFYQPLQPQLLLVDKPEMPPVKPFFKTERNNAC